MSPRQRTSVFLDEHLAEGLKSLKARDGVTEAEAIRRAIGEYLARRGVVVDSKPERKRAATRRRS